MNFNALSICSMLVAATLPAWPQAGTATVRGSVRDQAQAIIPNARVTLTNTATNIGRQTLSNDAGLYVLPGVIPGAYRLEVAVPGMQAFEGNLTVYTQQDATVDVVMKLAQTTTEIQVQDVTPLVQTDSPSLGHVLERQRIEELPGLGRGYQNLLQTVPGVVWSTHGHGVGGMMHGYGLLSGSNQLVFDGTPINEVWEGWDMPRQPDLDTIQELHIEVNNSSARYARPTSVIMSMRSGTNQFHGSAFENNRNSGYGVARQRQDTFTKAPFTNRNEYGVTAGGPVLLPKIYDGRNRTFWFYSFEGTDYVTYTTTRVTVPTEAMKNGDFRGLVDGTGRQILLYDPYTTDPKTYQREPLAWRGVPNTIDPARFSPLAKTMINLMQPPTDERINPMVDSNRVVPSLRPLWQRTFNTRIDHHFSAKDQLFARYSYNTHKEELTSGFVAWKPLGGVDVIDHSLRWWPDHTASANWMHMFSSTMTNEVLVTGLRDWQQRGAGVDPPRFGGQNLGPYASLLGIPNPLNADNWPNINNFGLGGMTAGGESPFYLISNYVTFEDNATKVKGKHELQFGLQFRYEQVTKNTNTTASVDLNTLATAQYDPTSTAASPLARPQTGLGLANLMLGVSNYSTSFGRSWVFMRRNEYTPYIQDNWKVTPRLTLNLGLRWELWTPVFDKGNSLLSFSLDKKAYVLSEDLNRFTAQGNTLPAILTAFQGYGGKIIGYRDAGLPQRMTYYNWTNFGPRLGFAYRGFGGTKAFVLRGGYRVSSYTQPLSNWVGSQQNAGIVNGTFQYNLTNAALSPDGLPNYGLRTVPSYVAGQNTGNSLINVNDTRLLTRGFSAIALDPHLKDPRVQDWNLTLEKELGSSMVTRIGFVGNHTTNVQQTVNFNSSIPSYIWYATRKQPLPTGEFSNVATRPYDQQVYGNVDMYSSSGYAWYNGLQVELERRFNRGIGFQVFYNLANSLYAMGSISNPTSFLPGAVPADLDARNRFLNYRRDTTASSGGSTVGTPQHQLRWNFIADLPFGRNKPIAGNAKGIVETLIGGWQIAGTGSLKSSYWTLPTNIYPTGTPIEIYGYKYPIQDCTSGVCSPGYLWFNGYIPSNRINSVDAKGNPNGIMGVPDNYKPAGAPLIPWGSTAMPANAPAGTRVSDFWDSNTVWIPLSNGTVQRTTFDDGLHPWRNQAMTGPLQWFQDASLFKFFRLSERVTLRFNMDFFNVLNNPNDPTSVASNGVLSTRNSGTPARIMQLALRLTW